MDKEELKNLFEAPPLPAGANYGRMVERINQQQKAVVYLLTALGHQGRSILDIRDKMVEHKAAIEVLAGSDMTPLPEPAIVLPELVGFDHVQHAKNT